MRLLDNVCRRDGGGGCPQGFGQVDGEGGQHGGIVASDGRTLIIQIAEVADISDVAGRIAVGTHKPEGIAAIARDRRPPGTADFQDAPFDGGVCKVVPSVGIRPSVVLFAIRGTGDGSRSVQHVIALAADLRVVARPLSLFQLAVDTRVMCYRSFKKRFNRKVRK